MKRKAYNKGAIINGVEFINDVEPILIKGINYRRAEFKCKCGNVFTCLINSIVTGNTKSCGCYGKLSRSVRFTKHGLRKDPIYNIWCGIKTRCYNKKRIDYKYYGKIGITLSDEFHEFINFYKYVTSLPKYKNRINLKLTIDRINPNLNYERNNLRWATRKQQSLNQRRNSAC